MICEGQSWNLNAMMQAKREETAVIVLAVWVQISSTARGHRAWAMPSSTYKFFERQTHRNINSRCGTYYISRQGEEWV